MKQSSKLDLLKMIHGNNDVVAFDFRELTEDERDSVKEMTETEGWQILRDKVLPRQEYGLALACAQVSAEKILSAQGMYAGFKLCRQVIEQAATKA